ncbi:hypothetical protein F2Q70_00036645 [Brassica cretica]|uniref:SWIM-type domain-containing protein n=1 Tax=Brassica cretica TaxID=69181 RepID=A0A8S9JXY7_BRACR|nr:hypothetical protein F2Q70_00036645 [Brassica cretica]
MNNGWGFLVDEEKGGRLLTLDTSSSFENLKVMVCEDFVIDVNMVNIELSDLPSDLINSIYSPPVIITSDRQVRNFLTYVKNKASTQLCVSTQASNIAEEGTESPNREEAPMESDDSSYMESDDAADMDSEEDVEVPDSEDDKKCDKEKINEDGVRFSLVDVVKKEGLTGSSYFIIKKYVPDHSCAASNRKGSVRTVSTKTMGTLIMHKRIEKGKTFKVFPVSDHRFLVQGDTFDCSVDLFRHTCSFGKFDLMKIPCRHAIKAGFSVGIRPHTLTDDMYTTASWRSAYEESINPISVPKDAWKVPSHVEKSKILPPESRRAAGRRKKHRYETSEDKIRSSQGTQGSTVRNAVDVGLKVTIGENVIEQYRILNSFNISYVSKTMFFFLLVLCKL